MKDKHTEIKQTESTIAYEGILYNAFNRVVFSRAEDPFRMYPLAVEALVLAVPKWENIEGSIEEFKKKDWENIKREIDKKESDARRRKILYYDALFKFVKHRLEDKNLLLRFRNIPVGGGFDGW